LVNDEKPLSIELAWTDLNHLTLGVGMVCKAESQTYELSLVNCFEAAVPIARESLEFRATIMMSTLKHVVLTTTREGSELQLRGLSFGGSPGHVCRQNAV